MKTTYFATYSRFSTDEQGGEALSSCDIQDTLTTTYGQAQGWQMAGAYRDEGRTGSNLGRAGWRSLLADAQAGRFEKVVVTYMSRLGRGDAYTLAEHELRKAGVAIVLVNESFPDGVGGWVAQKATQLMDGMYPQMVREWTKTALLDRLRRGFHTGGGVPFGYQLVEAVEFAQEGKRTPKRMVPAEDAHLVAEAFGTMLSTKSIAVVRDLLEERTGQTFRLDGVVRLLRNRSYLGEWTWGEHINESHHEPLVQRGLFDAVQGVLADRVRTSPRPAPERSTADNLMVGRIRCSCGRAMTPAAARGRGKVRYPYYRCMGMRDRLCYCQVNADALHALLVGELIQMARHPWRLRRTLERTAAQMGDPEETLRSYKAVLRKLRAEEAALQNVMGAIGSARSSAARDALVRELDRKSEALVLTRQEVESAKLEVERANANRPTVASLTSLLVRFDEIWQAATDLEKRVILRSFVDSVTVTGRRPLKMEVKLNLRECSEGGSNVASPSMGYSESTFKGPRRTDSLTVFIGYGYA